MRKRGSKRGWFLLLLWCGLLATGLALFHAVGDGPLAPPPPDPAAWTAWLAERDGLVATAALLRLVVLALTWYLVGATAVGLVARLARSVRAVRFADALTVPALRRLLQASVGLSLATGVVVSAVPAGVAVAGEPPAVIAGEADATPGRAEVATPALDVISAWERDLPPPLRLLGGEPAPSSATDLDVVVPEPLPSERDAPVPPPLRRLDVPASATEVPDAATDDQPLSTSVPAPGSAGREVVLRHLGPSGADAGRWTGRVPSGPVGAEGSAAPVGPAGQDAVTSTARRGEAGHHSITPRGAGLDAGTPPARGDERAEDGASGPPATATLPEEGTAERPGEEHLEELPDATAEHTVVAGESLWTIARDVVAGELGRGPTEAEVVGYWLDLVEVQRPFLANPDDPDLIFPGERVRLPATAGRWRG